MKNLASLTFLILYAIVFVVLFRGDDIGLVQGIVSFFIIVLSLCLSQLLTAGETFGAYKRVMRVLEKYGLMSQQFKSIYPSFYCSNLGYKMAVRDFEHRIALNKTST